MVNASRAVSARKRAREASLRFYEREKERERVQERYFASMDAVDRVYAQRDREIAAAEERAENAAAAALGDADAAIRELIELRVSRSEVQERLGCTAADVRRAVEASAETTQAEQANGELRKLGEEPVPAYSDGVSETWSGDGSPVDEDVASFATQG